MTDLTLNHIPQIVGEVLQNQQHTPATFDQAIVDIAGKSYIDSRVLGDTSALMLETYWLETQRFWNALRLDEEPGPYVALRRLLLTSKQKTRKDLHVEYDALLATPHLGAIVDHMLEKEPDFEVVENSAVPYLVDLVDHANGAHTLTVFYTRDSIQHWSNMLGGPFSPGEQARELRVTSRHAPWRDRKKRRLSNVDVYAHELWPQVIQ